MLLRIIKQKKGISPKFANKFAGPYKVMSQLSPVNYRIKDLSSNREDTVHSNRMKLLPEKQIDSEITQDTVDELFGLSDEDQEEFEGFSDVESSADEETREVNEVAPLAEGRYRPLGRGSFFLTLGIKMLLIFLCCGFPTLSYAFEHKIGPVFDCNLVRHEGIYSLPEDSVCEDFSKIGRVHTFRAEVKHFQQSRQRVNLYHCSQEQVSLACNENFLGVDHKKLTVQPQRMGAELCRQAMTSKITPHVSQKITQHLGFTGP